MKIAHGKCLHSLPPHLSSVQKGQTWHMPRSLGVNDKRTVVLPKSLQPNNTGALFTEEATCRGLFP